LNVLIHDHRAMQKERQIHTSAVVNIGAWEARVPHLAIVQAAGEIEL
jgi:hypothetical protein